MINNSDYLGLTLQSSNADFTNRKPLDVKGNSEFTIKIEEELNLEQINYKGEPISALRINFSSVLIGAADDEEHFKIEISFFIRFRINNPADLTQEDINKSHDVLEEKGKTAAQQIFQTLMKLADIEKVS